MENKNYSDVIGQSDQPFTNSLATQYGLATQSYAVNHPSLPNYLDIVSGQDPSNSTDDGPPIRPHLLLHDDRRPARRGRHHREGLRREPAGRPDQ